MSSMASRTVSTPLWSNEFTTPSILSLPMVSMGCFSDTESTKSAVKSPRPSLGVSPIVFSALVTPSFISLNLATSIATVFGFNKFLMEFTDSSNVFHVGVTSNLSTMEPIKNTVNDGTPIPNFKVPLVIFVIPSAVFPIPFIFRRDKSVETFSIFCNPSFKLVKAFKLKSKIDYCHSLKNLEDTRYRPFAMLWNLCVAICTLQFSFCTNILF
eukprot:NODE_47_length_32105_cov_1.240892.p19 type:complete len:212 gc:universal NODE_47_length_32105_cov_1.240892:26932-27567(+)